MKKLLELADASEEEITMCYEVFFDIIMKKIYGHVRFYYFCKAGVKEEVLMGYLCDIDKKNIINYNATKAIYDYMTKKEWTVSYQQ